MDVMLLVGTSKGAFILESDDSRRKWSVRGPYLKGWKVYSLLGRRDNGAAEIFAGLGSDVYGSHLQKSADSGKTWSPIANGPRFADGSRRRLQQVWALGTSPTGRFYAGVAEAALFISEDGGAQWRLNDGLEGHPTREEWQPGAGGLCLHTVIEDAKDRNRVFIGISAVGLLRSDDRGRTWKVKNEGVTPVDIQETPKYNEINRCLHKVVQDPADPARLYQQNHTGVYRSQDAGDSWERIENGLPARFGFPIAMHPRNPKTLYVIPQESDEFRMFKDGHLGVYRTADAGDSWKAAGRGLPDDNYAGVLRDGLAVDRLDPAGIYFGTTGGQLFMSSDEGDSWRILPGTYPRILTVKIVA